jgi:hypothetical protein
LQPQSFPQESIFPLMEAQQSKIGTKNSRIYSTASSLEWKITQSSPFVHPLIYMRILL